VIRVHADATLSASHCPLRQILPLASNVNPLNTIECAAIVMFAVKRCLEGRLCSPAASFHGRSCDGNRLRLSPPADCRTEGGVTQAGPSGEPKLPGEPMRRRGAWLDQPPNKSLAMRDGS
jgi:hypothetical protein